MNERLCALLVTGEYPPMEGGVADFTSILGERLVEKGAEVHVLTSQHATVHPESDVTVHPVVQNWGFRALYSAMRDLQTQITPDVINIQYQTAAYGMHPAVNLLPRFFARLPMVVTFHDLRVPYLLPKASGLREWVNRELARSARGVIVTNAQDRMRLQDVSGIDEMEMIPIGSSISYQLPDSYDRTLWRGHWGVSSRTTLLCHFGFLNESKGALDLIAALGRACRDGLDVDLMMIGGAVGASDATNRLYYDRVKRAIDEEELKNRVFWTGYVPNEEVSAAFKSSDICVLPFVDGASFRRSSLMAALTHGMAIISTEPQIHLPEIVHGENMYLVPPRSPEALAKGIHELAQDADLRERLGSGARELSQHFDWDRIAERTLMFYRRAAGSLEADAVIG